MSSFDHHAAATSLSGQLREAMTVLFTPMHGHNDRIQQANRFLLEASEHPLAFAALIHLITHESDFRIAHFSVNLLYNKVRRGWSQLGETDRITVVSELYRLLQQSQALLSQKEFKVFCDRLVYALSAASIKVPNGLKPFLELALNLVRTDNGGGGPSLLLGLEMISILSEEIDTSDVSRSLKLEVEGQLSEGLAPFVTVAEGLLQSLSLTPSSSGTATSSLSLPHITAIALLKLVQVYCKQGQTLSKFARDHPLLLDLLLQRLFLYEPHTHNTHSIPQTGLTMAENEQQGSLAHAIIRSLLATSEYPRVPATLLAKQTLSRYLVPQISRLIHTYQTVSTQQRRESGGIDGETVEELVWLTKEVTQTVIVVLLAELDTMIGCAKGDSDSEDSDGERGRTNALPSPPSAAESGYQHALQHLFIAFTELLSLPPRSLLMISFDFWTEIEDSGCTDTQGFLRREILPRLLRSLVSLTTYDTAREIGGESDGEEDFLQLRDRRLGIQELTLFCFYGLGGDFFTLIQDTLTHFERCQSQGETQALQAVSEYSMLVCVYVSPNPYLSV